MNTKLLRIGDDLITAKLIEIDIDPKGFNVVEDIGKFEKEISICLIETKLKILQNGANLSFVIFYKLRIRYVAEELARISCSVIWNIDGEPPGIINPPLKLEVRNFYISLFETAYYITMGALQQVVQQRGLKSWEFGVFEEGYAIQALEEKGLNTKHSP